MVDCRKHAVNNTCEPTDLVDQTPVTCEPFSHCLSFGRSLVYDGHCFKVTGETTVPDGRYGVMIVQDGCIVGAEPAPVFQYTPPPCAPAVGPCDDPESAGTVVLQPHICNLLEYDGANRLGGFLTVTAGDNITVTGCGSTGDPLVISANYLPQTTYFRSLTPDVLPLTGSGTAQDPYTIRHAESILTGGTYGPFQTDQYGHLTGYTPSDTGITGLVEGPGITLTNAAGVYTVSQATTPLGGGTFVLGGFSLSFDLQGNAISSERIIAVQEGTYDPDDVVFTINELGSIIGIDVKTHTVDTNFSSFYSGNRDTNVMSFNVKTRGAVRVKYIGDLGPSTATDSGLLQLSENLQLNIDGAIVSTFMVVTSNRIVEVHALSNGILEAGVHRVELAGTPGPDGEPAFTAVGFMDVILVTVGV